MTLLRWVCGLGKAGSVLKIVTRMLNLNGEEWQNGWKEVGERTFVRRCVGVNKCAANNTYNGDISIKAQGMKLIYRMSRGPANYI